MRTEAWWVCHCGTPIYRVGKGKGDKWTEHVKTCALRDNPSDRPGMSIEQLPQSKK